jgi:hypothetical protein
VPAGRIVGRRCIEALNGLSVADAEVADVHRAHLALAGAVAAPGGVLGGLALVSDRH